MDGHPAFENKQQNTKATQEMQVACNVISAHVWGW
jgi:hypothetical protein